MSNLTDYEVIRTELGEEVYKDLSCYLTFHPHILLSDVYYSKDEWERAQAWLKETPSYIKDNPPLYMVVENYKGLCEHNFVGIKEEVLQSLGMTEKDLDYMFYHLCENDGVYEPVREEAPVHYKRSNLTYEIHVAKSKDEIKAFFEGIYNETETHTENPDWYYSFDRSMCGSVGIKILSIYQKENQLLEILAPELFQETGREKGVLSVTYDEYLNHKPIDKCISRKDMEQHNHDNEKMFALLETANTPAVLICAKYMDAAHKGEVSYHYVPLDKLRAHMDSYDQKNGMDFVIHDDKLGLVIYGQNYTYGESKTHGMVEVCLSIQLFDEKKTDLSSIEKTIDEMSSDSDIQNLLACVSKEDVFLDTTTLKDKIRSVRRLPLDEQIENSKKIQKEQRAKRKGKGSKSRDNVKQNEKEF